MHCPSSPSFRPWSRHHAARCVLLLLLAPACVGRTAEGDDGSGSGGVSSSSEGGATTSTSSAGGTTATSSTTTAADTGTTTTSTTTAVDSSSGADTFSFVDPTDASTGVGMQPNGAECMDATACSSGFCINPPGPGGGVCSECAMDADCDMGTCSFEFQVGYAVCTDGGLGDGCDSDRGCMGALVCSSTFAGGGPQRCSECSDTTPCAGEAACAPHYDGSLFASWRACVELGSVADGGGCPVDDMGQGDGSVCSSGICGVDTIMMGNTAVGICSACDDDTDCAEGTTCTPANVAMMGVVEPGTCG